ncbi:hypothetical protein AURANDRAFT_72852, partial [Aureococcus anophagefferens]
MQLSASIETPRLRLAVAGLAPRGFLATVDGDDDVRVDADYCARLDASVRQLVDLDVVIERRVAPYAEAAAALRGASLKALKAAHEPAADCHFAEVRLGEADRDVHGFHAARRAGAPLAASSKKLDGFDFALRPCGDGRTLLVELARPRPRGGPGADATPLCCGLSAGAEGEAEGAASLAARGSWTSNGADDGAADGAAAPPATLLAAGDRAAVHGLDCAGTLNALARAHGDRVLRDRVALAQASLDAAASDAAAGVAKAREPTALLVAGAGQKRRRELTTLKSDLRTRAKKKRGKRRVADESDSDGEDDDGTFRYTFATPDAPGSRPRDVAPAADATLEAALAALEASEIPVQDSRTNVTRPGAPAPRGLVLGAVNVRGHGGMRVSGATHERPRLAKLLCDVFRAHAPDPAFRFTTIQINCNYEAALHVDKFNLGPSYIVGVGDYGPPEDPKLPAEFAGRLWVQGRGALDVREQFVLFDGNAPHSTIPFAGARYTLIFFTHASQYALPEGERAYCDALGFPMPHPKLCKPPHMRTAEERLMAGRDAYAAWEREVGGGAAAAAPARHKYFLDGAGGRPSQRVAALAGGSAPQLRRHYGRAVRAAAESREGGRAAAATFVTGDREGEAADEARCRADVVADDLVAEALAHRKPFVGRVERWEAACANRRDEAGGARLLAKYAGLCLLDDDPYDAHSDVASLGRRLSDS